MNFNKIRFSKFLILILALSLTLGGCKAKDNGGDITPVDNGQVEENVENVEKVIDPTTGLEKIGDAELKFANHFNVEYLQDGYKLITDSSDRKILLVPEGKEAPEMPSEVAVIQQPIESIGTTATIQPSWLRPINEIGKVVTVAYPLESWYIDEIISGMEEGSITYVGKPASPDYEMIKAIEPDITFISTSYTETLSPKYDELELNYLMFGAHLEEDPRGRIEWVKLTGALFNKEEEANNFFESELAKIEDLKVRIAEYTGEKPKVASSYFSDSKSLFYVRNKGDYQIRMFEMAGGEYVLEDFNPEKQGNTTMTAEEFYKAIENADILIYDNVSGKGIQKLEDFYERGEFLKDIKAIKEGRVWGLQPVYWQVGESLSDMLEDLFTIFTTPHGEIKETEYFFLME